MCGFAQTAWASTGGTCVLAQKPVCRWRGLASPAPVLFLWLMSAMGCGGDGAGGGEEGPVLSAHPAIVDLATATAQGAFTIRNTGGGELRWACEGSDAWIRLSARSGTGERVIQVTANAEGLGEGRHEGRVDVTSNGGVAQVTVGVSIGAADPFAGSPTIDGVPIFPNDNPWNTDISQYPVHPNSGAYIASIGTEGHLHADFGSFWEGEPIGIPYVVVGAGQPLVPVSFEYADESDPGPYPIPPDAPIEGGPDSEGDRHVLVLDRDARKLYELYDAHPSDGSWTAGSGAVFDLTSNALRPEGWTSADAAGLPVLPGLVRYEEVAAGEIRHAVRFTCRRTQRAYVHPATHWASSSTDPNLPPMGLRVRLRGDYDISGFPQPVRVILSALKRYGMILADNGSDWYITGTHDTRWDDEVLGAIAGVPGSAFEAVDTGPLVTPSCNVGD